MILSKPVGFILFLPCPDVGSAAAFREVLAIFHSGARNFLVRWVKVLRTLIDRAAALTLDHWRRRLCMESMTHLPQVPR
ncbi:hypothetical protein U879_12915 [Defluviimonas sp. 20V17]|nr:hypothetical protein U879_12915 [Defluviimonas sp. 20V17]